MTTSGHFTNPPNDGSGVTYTFGSIVQLAWQTSLERITLTLFTVSETGFDYLPASANLTNTNSFPWSVGSISSTASYPAVEIKQDYSNRAFFFAIFIPGNTAASFSSGRFRIVDSISASTGAISSSFSSPSLALTSTTTSSSVSASAAIFSSSTTTSSSSVSASTAIFSSSPTSSILTTTQSFNPASSTALATNSGLSKGAKAGIGVGIGIGIPLLLALGIILGWKFRGGRRTSNGSRGGYNASNGGVAEIQPASKEDSRLRMKNLPQAPQAESRPNELSSTPIHQLE